MQGYYWAKTPENELFVVLVTGGKGYVPGVEGAIDLGDFFMIEPVQWPPEAMPTSRSFAPPKPGRPVQGVTHECAILPFAANG